MGKVKRRPKTGINTKTVSFSVHKDFVDVVKATVNSKVTELKELQRKANETGEFTITFTKQGEIKHKN